MRRAATLLELALSIVLFGIVMGLVTRAAVFHDRFQRHERSAWAGARAARQAAAIVAGALAGAAPSDLVVGQSSDSVLDVWAPVADGIACMDGDRATFVSDASPDDPGSASVVSAPRAGDRLLAFDDRGAPPAWVARTVVAVMPGKSGCPAIAPPSAPTTTLALGSALGVAPLAAFHLGRRTRFNLYRGGDGAWYLGMREWNPDAGQFDGVQPVTGPLRARSVRADRTGLHFEYLDANARALPTPIQSPESVAVVRITVRSADSAAAPVVRDAALRRAP